MTPHFVKYIFIQLGIKFVSTQENILIGGE